MTGELLAAQACRATAVAVMAGCIPLALDHHWLAFALLLCMVPGLLIVGGCCHRAHAHSLRQARVHDLQTTPPTRKDTTPA